jgi:ATP-binding protein involved in chromosome partitioning
MSDLQQQVMSALSTVIEPELHQDIVSLDMVRDLTIVDGTARFTIVLTTPACPLKHVFEANCQAALVGVVPGITAIEIKWDAMVPQDARIEVGMSSIVAVSSGKGGVGKSTIATNLAVALAAAGAKVGLIDADILNPNLPQMLGLREGRPRSVEGKLLPLEVYGVKVMSMGFLTPSDRPLIMRGPMLHGAIRQFFTDVLWGDLDYMIVDLPPGTGDAPLSLAQSFPLTGAIIVTQPQAVAVADALRATAMFEELNVPIVGVVENMAGDFFGTGGGEALAEKRDVPFLGRVHLATNVREGGDYGRPVVVVEPDTPSGREFAALAENIAARISVLILTGSEQAVKIKIVE